MPRSLSAKKRISRDALRDAAKSRGPLVVANHIREDLFEGRLDPDQLSVRALWEAFVGPVAETLGDGGPFSGPFTARTLVEDVRSQAFSFATGSLIATTVMESYAEQQSVLDALVTTETSTRRVDYNVGFQAFNGMQDVSEGKEYPSGAASEKVVAALEPSKRGWKIEITEECVIHDQTGSIISQASDMGRTLRDDRERRGMYFIQDLASTPAYNCYYPVAKPNVLPIQTALFRSSAGSNWYDRTINLKATNALQDWTDIDNALQLFFAMKDEADQYISITPNTILVPRALLGTALRIVNATQVRETTNTNTASYSPNIVNLIGGGFNVVTSPFLVDTSFVADSTSWFIGDFKRQYRERVLIPPGVQQIPADPRRDILAGYVCRHKTHVYAREDKFVVKSTT